MASPCTKGLHNIVLRFHVVREMTPPSDCRVSSPLSCRSVSSNISLVLKETDLPDSPLFWRWIWRCRRYRGITGAVLELWKKHRRCTHAVEGSRKLFWSCEINTDAVPKLILLILSDYSKNSAFSTCQYAVYVVDVGREGVFRFKGAFAVNSPKNLHLDTVFSVTWGCFCCKLLH